MNLSPLDEVRQLVNSTLRDPGSVVEWSGPRLDLLVRLLRDVSLHGKLAVELKRLDAFDALPQTVRDQLESARVTAEARARVTSWEMNRIAWATGDQDELKIAVMKGCAYIALGLPMVEGRIFADVDLFVAEDEIRSVESLLNRRGWRTRELSPYDDNYYRRWTHEIPPLMHVERDVEIDIHHNLLPRTARLKPEGAKLFSAVHPIDGTPYHVLADVDLVLHAMTHLMFNDDMVDKLRDLVDIDELLRHFSEGNPDFWQRLIERAEELDLKRAAFYGLRYTHRYLETPVPEEQLHSIAAWGPGRLGERLMDAMVPRALYPQHPEHPRLITALSRRLLYVRSHWIRMPPWLLAYHLAYKFVVKRLGSRTKSREAA